MIFYNADMRTYHAMIFDCGGVIIHVSFDKAFTYWATVSGADASRMRRRFDFDEIYQRFERGEISASRFRKNTMDKLGFRISDEEFDNGWNSIYVEVVPGIAEFLQELRSMYRLVALTNTNEIHAERWPILYSSVLSYFEKVFCSHEIGARKPEKRAYETVVNYLGVDPQHALYFDDNLEFVRAAAALNIPSIHVTSFKQMTDEMREHGVQLQSAV
jgi:putative hydrolase of the HAD superfamily